MRHPAVSRAPMDLLLLTIGGTLVFLVLATLEVFTHLAQWLHAQELVDDLVSLVVVVVCGVAVFSWRRWRELQAAQQQIRLLAGVIQICAWCHKARSADGPWVSLEDYVRRESDAGLSPDLCPDCTRGRPATRARRAAS
jgi:uncharacterized membrane protein SirB2